MAVFLSNPEIALAISVIGGALVTFIWAECWYRAFRKQLGANSQRARGIAALNGVVIRGLLTTTVIWMPQTTGAIVAGLLAVHGFTAWGGLQPQQQENIHGRTRYTISMLNHIISIFWAIAWGIPAMLARSHGSLGP
jgi:hypothetical protein